MKRKRITQEVRQAQQAWSTWLDDQIDAENDQMLLEAVGQDNLRIVRL